MKRRNRIVDGSLANRHPLYRAWVAMHQRCRDSNHKSYKNYGGRGISVCEQWKDFIVFVKDVGSRPSEKHTLDRINNNGNYEPSNFKWSTQTEQLKNKRKKYALRLT